MIEMLIEEGLDKKGLIRRVCRKFYKLMIKVKTQIRYNCLHVHSQKKRGIHI